MATFVHIAPAKSINSIKRAGIKTSKGGEGYPDGVFAQAVTPNFFISHQWLRELKRNGYRVFYGVYFSISDDETVWVGHYNQQPITTTASEAIGIVQNNDNSLGYQVYIPRKIEKKEILKIRYLPQNIGWRYYPEAHRKKPCGCPVCLRRGEIKSQRIREKWEREVYG